LQYFILASQAAINYSYLELKFPREACGKAKIETFYVENGCKK
jgi:hypothetical protein